MKKKNNSKSNNKNVDIIFIVLIILLIIMTLTLIIIKIINKDEISTSSAKVQELYNYFSTEDLNNCEGLFTYQDSKVDNKSVKADLKKCLAYNKATLGEVETLTLKQKKKTETCVQDDMTFRIDEDSSNCTVTKVSKDIINKEYVKLFGEEINDAESFKPDNYHICYLKDNEYYCGLAESFTYTLGNDSSIYRVIKKAIEKSSGEVIIHDYFLKINNNACYNSYTTDTENTECTANYKENNKVDFNFMKHNGQLYKHTFKKAKDGSYYWVSSEPVK